MTIKVIGAGFGRTGTNSIQSALEELGFGKCYHMRDVLTQPAHAQLWLARAQGQPIDWDALFEGCQSTVDWPGCSFYQELMQRYPEAKVLLSVRDPQRWYTSTLNTIYSVRYRSPMRWMMYLVPRMRVLRRMLDTILWQGTFHGRFTDRAYAIEVFNQHNAEVQRVVPPERLLVYEVGQGWEPLCRFLGVPVPQGQPFPHLNDTAAFQAIIQRGARARQLALGGAALTGLAMLAGAIMVARKASKPSKMFA
jgi:hypothetical protein